MIIIINIYNSYKKLHPDKIILIQKGHFYILLADDAITLSKFISLKINEFSKEKLPMCGFPKNSLEKYIQKIKLLGFSMAIISETAEYCVKTGKKIRELDQIVEVLCIKKELRKINIDEITPLEAHKMLASWIEKVGK